MRFMILVKATKTSEAGVLPDEKLLTELGKYNESLANGGVLLAGEGLQPSSNGARVKFFGPALTPEVRAAEERMRIGGRPLAGRPHRWRARRRFDRRQPPAAVGDERGQEPHDQWDQSGGKVTAHQRDRDGAHHDDHQADGGQRGQLGPDTQERGQDQTEGAEHLDRAEESNERARQRDRTRQLIERHDQLHRAGEQKEGRQQHLNDPQHTTHVVPFLSFAP